ncbi:MAG: phenylphosphate carboxylase subunit gamma [Rhodocyclaceae bacterium]|jgi:phenylphosphate carboxylase gamma subunit|nr:phenylphosphate carboxylase subunit gamma [Rhodocyclaceae bacterium]MBK6553732.1 phenylphosphate carboxylase subunit gamma [Rhodocyclaceae bacterium]MBK6678329.1 phenylphosphate carboxylase subunit gamma [Rhodocyclaceae bacterium]MBK7813632.1 phenylphosphate carboxylase subunit gamma [Rhodocyclaceae bacterium]MBK9310989.1 phenylphosphate carboxylase subunit gamma [Rhodocyclaceae bacterium]
MNQWEVFVNDVKELAEDTDLELTIRTLNPGLHKFTYKRVKCQVSTNLKKHVDQLQVRLGRGQLSNNRFSIQVLDEVQRMPAKYL